MGKKARLEVPPLGPGRNKKSKKIEARPLSKSVSGSSRLYTPFRAIGYISGGVPFALLVRRGGKDSKVPDVNIVTALPGSGGLDTWALWDATTMRLLFVGPSPPPESQGGGRIVAMGHSTNPDGLLVAYQGGLIRRFNRSNVAAEYKTWLSEKDRQRIARKQRERAAMAKAAMHENSSSSGTGSDSDSDSDNSASESSQNSSSSDSDPSPDETSKLPHNLLYAEEQLDTPIPLMTMIVFGHTLCALSADGRWLFSWNITEGTESLNRVDLAPADTGDRRATALVHPDTHLNKVLVGFTDGSVEVWNVRSGKRVHVFDGNYLHGLANPQSQRHPVDAAGKRVVALEQSPALDIVAIGFSSGHVLIHDVRLDEPIFYLRLSSSNIDGSENPSAVDVLAPAGISFRSDWKQHTVALAGMNGSIAIYNLDGVHAPVASSHPAAKKAAPRPARALHVIRNAHERSVGGLAFVPGQPLLISSSADNSFKQWFFDDPDTAISDTKLGGNSALDGSTAASAGGGPPRLLKSRGGHFEPPHIARHYGDNGKNLLTASRDLSVRCLSVVRDSRSFELSQGSIQRRARELGVDPRTLKLPAATDISFSLTRSRDWADVVTTHSGSPWARTWTVWDKHMTKDVLRTGQVEATTSFVSACGNFALVGTARGKVECYYLQSARTRRVFDTRPIDQAAWDAAQQLPLEKRVKAEKNARIGLGARVTGAVMDNKNRTVAICTTDRWIRFYDFYSGDLLDAIELDAEPQRVVYSREADLVAVSLADLTVVLLDLELRRIVRQFSGFRAKVLDMSLSSDSRWLVTTSEDSVVRTFDIPTSTLVDVFRTPSTATSVSISPTLDFLATTHVGVLGVYLWANRSLFSNVALKAIDEDALVEEVSMPTLAGASTPVPTLETSDASDDTAGAVVYTSPPQMFDQEEPLLTLSTMPRSRWLTLLNLDLIKERDKPIEPPKPPEKAPFFLPQVAGTTASWDVDSSKARPNLGDQLATDQTSTAASRITSGTFDVESDFVQRLKRALNAGNSAQFFLYLNALTPPQLDVELRSLVRPEEMRWFIQILTLRLEAGQDFEAVQAMLAVFLKLHQEDLIEQGALASLRNLNLDGEGPAIEEGRDTPMRDASDEEDDEEGALLRQALQQLMVQLDTQSSRVMDLLDYCTGTLAFLRDIPLI